MTEPFGLAGLTLCNTQHKIEDLSAHIIERGLCAQYASRIDVHVIGQSFIRVRVRTNLNHRADSRTYDRASARGEQRQVSPTTDQLNDLCIV